MRLIKPSVAPKTGHSPTTRLYSSIEGLLDPALPELSKITVSFWSGFRHRFQTQEKVYPFQMSHSMRLTRIVENVKIRVVNGAVEISLIQYKLVDKVRCEFTDRVEIFV